MRRPGDSARTPSRSSNARENGVAQHDRERTVAGHVGRRAGRSRAVRAQHLAMVPREPRCRHAARGLGRCAGAGRGAAPLRRRRHVEVRRRGPAPAVAGLPAERGLRRRPGGRAVVDLVRRLRAWPHPPGTDRDAARNADARLGVSGPRPGALRVRALVEGFRSRVRGGPGVDARPAVRTRRLGPPARIDPDRRRRPASAATAAITAQAVPLAGRPGAGLVVPGRPSRRDGVRCAHPRRAGAGRRRAGRGSRRRLGVRVAGESRQPVLFAPALSRVLPARDAAGGRADPRAGQVHVRPRLRPVESCWRR